MNKHTVNYAIQSMAADLRAETIREYESRGFKITQMSFDEFLVELPDKNVVPPMTHPLSRNWNQPKASDILIDDTHALMSQVTFDKLANYAYTDPTGCYEGKMWRREQYLCWFGYSMDPDKCSNNLRRIIIV